MVKAATSDAGAKIVKLKDEQGKTWSDIADAVGLPVGKAMLEYEKAMVTPKNKLGGRNDDELKANIVKARKEGLSWGRIIARSGKSEGFCRAAYEEATGKSSKGDRIGKGGRFPTGEGPEPGAAKPAKKAEKATAKASKTVKKAAKKAPASKKAAAKKTPIKKAAKKATA